MPVPKQKHSKARTRKRRAQSALKPKELISCANCGRLKLNHLVCPSCGYYKKRSVIDVLQKIKPHHSLKNKK